MQVSFFTAPNCGLCEQAKSLLVQVPKAQELSVEYINIRTEPDYLHRYGARIPVIMRNDNQAELEWPFNIEQLTAFIHE